jgi:hypothetical protein
VRVKKPAESFVSGQLAVGLGPGSSIGEVAGAGVGAGVVAPLAAPLVSPEALVPGSVLVLGSGVELGVVPPEFEPEPPFVFVLPFALAFAAAFAAAPACAFVAAFAAAPALPAFPFDAAFVPVELALAFGVLAFAPSSTGVPAEAVASGLDDCPHAVNVTRAMEVRTALRMGGLSIDRDRDPRAMRTRAIHFGRASRHSRARRSTLDASTVNRA